MAAKSMLAAIGLLLALGTSFCRAEDWTTTDGKVFQNVKVVSFNDGFASIIDNDGGARVPLRLLNADLQKQFHYDAAKAAVCEAATKAQDDADANAAAAKLAAEKATSAQAVANAPLITVIPHGFSPLSSAPPYGGAQSRKAIIAPTDNPLTGLKIDEDGADPSSAAADTFLGRFAGHLVVLNHGHTKPADRSLLDGVKFVAFYYSASWCGPCRGFTPKLVTFYNNFKATHPNFELILVNRDEDEDAMLNYMVGDNMPWPAVRFDDINSSRLKVRQYEGSGIPDLVLVNEQGSVIADSFVNGEYYGPESVMDAIMQKVPIPPPATAPAGPATAGP